MKAQSAKENVYVIHVSQGFGFARLGSVRAASALEASLTWEAIAAAELGGRLALAVKVRP